MAFVDELGLNDDHLLHSKYTYNAVVDGQIVKKAKLTLVHKSKEEDEDDDIYQHGGGGGGGGGGSPSLQLYRAVLVPKRWRYTGLGSKMNDKQAMTHNPVVNMSHAAGAPKGCLVTLRTMVYVTTTMTEEEQKMDGGIIREPAQNAPRYHECGEKKVVPYSGKQDREGAKEKKDGRAE